MRVVQATAFGGPSVLVGGEAPEPVARAGQVVIAVGVAVVEFVETQIRRGESPGPALPRPPYVPGHTVAGEVLRAGAGVDSHWVGRRVVASALGGGYVERAVAAVDELVPVPEGVRLREAAALHGDGSTALGLMENARIRPGEWVLVEAAGGGVGSLLVQLADAAGARVIGAAGGQRKLRPVRELGARVAVDSSEPEWTKRVHEATDGAGPDVVFDGVGGETGRAAFGVTARGGRFSVHGASSGTLTRIDPEEAERRGVTVLGIEQLHRFPAGAGRRAGQALAEAAAGRLTPLIGGAFPLERACEAHAAIEARDVVGKTLLLV
ncbi:zinc-binding dehydrogenase [Streptomyces sp. 8N706]|uniref:zinc-binding dehydrogenase n=1 Tax=Streptomyces sp. 8N706 TaxID=3457416 RepID=UPI003FD3B637